MKTQGGRMIPIGEVRSVGRAMFAIDGAAREIERAVSVVQAGASSVPASELAEYAAIARIYVDVWEKSREAQRRIKAMAQRLDSKRA